MLQLLNGSKLADKVSTKVLLNNLEMLSVNQTNAQIKLLEVWKSQNVNDYPIKFQVVTNDCFTRAVSNGDLVEPGRTYLVKSSFIRDASKVWNNSPKDIKECTSIWASKKAIKLLVKQLPN